MYRIVQAANYDLADVSGFIETINGLAGSGPPEARTLFDPDKEIIVTRAPGRLDVMGGIADYSGALVLQLPLQEAALAAIQTADDGLLRLVSLNAADHGASSTFEMPMAAFRKDGRALTYDATRRLLSRNPKTAWAAYAAGVYPVLMRERHMALPAGARILIDSTVPLGRGVSSSAALEVAVMSAAAAAFAVDVNAQELARLCQLVENRIVGAPCGIMDQMTSVCGRPGALLSLLCQPAVLNEPVPVPDDLAFFGIDSGVPHAVSGSEYSAVRVGAFMGYRIIAEAAGLPAKVDKAKKQAAVDDEQWHGHLANIPPEVFKSFAGRLPEEMSGEAFIMQYGGSTDAVTAIDPGTTYPVANPTAHPVMEHARVCAFADWLRPGMPEVALRRLGALMYESHASYSACGLGTPNTDRIVALAEDLGPDHGIYGARITGGGSGGTVAVLAKANAGDAVARIAECYQAETGLKSQVFSSSSPGADAFGHLVLKTSQ